MKKERDELKKTMWNNKEPELEDLAISQPMHIYRKKKKACSEKNTKDVAKQSLDKETMLWLMDLTSHLSRNRDSAGIETDLCQQIHCWFELKKTKEVGWNEWELLNFLDFTKLHHGTIWMQLCTIFQGKGKMALKAIQGLSGLPYHHTPEG